MQGQDRWVSENLFPGVTDGFFVDVGSYDGVLGSNSFALERKGWKGICVDPFPVNMEGRTCQMFKDVVFSESGKVVSFTKAAYMGGISDTLGANKKDVERSPTVQLTTVTIGEILDRAKAPRFIHYMSLDIEGAELEALRGVPFDRYSFGAFTIEHNFEPEKRREMVAFLDGRGYRRINGYGSDDFFVPATHPFFGPSD